MKKLLLFIFIASVYSNAITCTEAVFAFYSTKVYDNLGKIRQDSSYFREYDTNVWTHKFYWTNGQLDSMLFDSKEGDPAKVLKYHIQTNENDLLGKDYEIIYSKETSGDTVIYKQKRYYNGQFEDFETIKMFENYIEALKEDCDGNKNFSKIYFSADTLIQEETFDYESPEARSSYHFFIPNPNDESKCSEFESDTKTFSKDDLSYELSSSEIGNGFVVKIESETYYREFYFIDGAKVDGTSSLKNRGIERIQKRTSRSFDALGRTGNAKFSSRHAAHFTVPAK